LRFKFLTASDGGWLEKKIILEMQLLKGSGLGLAGQVVVFIAAPSPNGHACWVVAGSLVLTGRGHLKFEVIRSELIGVSLVQDSAFTDHDGFIILLLNVDGDELIEVGVRCNCSGCGHRSSHILLGLRGRRQHSSGHHSTGVLSRSQGIWLTL
jgi:hypothetical protein